MKILYLKNYKWLSSQNQRVKTDVFGHRRYYALVKHIKTFFKKTLKRKDVSVLTINNNFDNDYLFIFNELS